MTDLPHHLAQAHLLLKTLSGNQPGMAIHWLAPNTLTTWVLAGLSLAFPALLLAKVMVLGLLVLSILGIALLAQKAGASSMVVPLSALLLFNQSLYWGFLPFLAGFAATLPVILLCAGPAGFSWRKTLVLALLFLLVYFSHVLWLAVSIVAAMLFALFSADRKTSLRNTLYAILPTIILACLWYPSLKQNLALGGFNVAAHWTTTPFERLNYFYIAYGMSGLKSDLNQICLITVLLFVSIGIARTIPGLNRTASLPLLMVGIMLLIAYMIVPDSYNNTILFSVRWLPYVFVFLLPGCLAPIRVSGWKRAVELLPSFSLAGYMLLTVVVWRSFDTDEMSGLRQALDKLPFGQKVLGLDFIVRSPGINTSYPYASAAAYAEAVKDSELNFSSAENPTSLVTYKVPPDRPYKWNLNMSSERVDRNDASYFDYILANANDNWHDKLASVLSIAPITHEGHWRLYKIVK